MILSTAVIRTAGSTFARSQNKSKKLRLVLMSINCNLERFGIWRLLMNSGYELINRDEEETQAQPVEAVSGGLSIKVLDVQVREFPGI